MPTWIEHMKKVHAAGSTSFKESLKRASASWKKVKSGAAAPAAAAEAPKKKGRRRKKKASASSSEAAEAEAAPKKKRRRRPGPKLPAGAYKSVDSRNL